MHQRAEDYIIYLLIDIVFGLVPLVFFDWAGNGGVALLDFSCHQWSLPDLRFSVFRNQCVSGAEKAVSSITLLCVRYISICARNPADDADTVCRL